MILSSPPGHMMRLMETFKCQQGNSEWNSEPIGRLPSELCGWRNYRNQMSVEPYIPQAAACWLYQHAGEMAPLRPRRPGAIGSDHDHTRAQVGRDRKIPKSPLSPTLQGIGNGSFKDRALSELGQVEKEQTPCLSSPGVVHAERTRGQIEP